jgi:hypothetical protein
MTLPPSIPANYFVNVRGSVLSAGGTALDLSGVLLTTNPRAPIGTVQPFPMTSAVSSYFGPAALETALAANYFESFNGSHVNPANLYITQYPETNVPAWLRGGLVGGLSLIQLQALSGSLGAVVDGYSRPAATVSLATATSFSTAATLLQTGLNSTLTASVTGSIAVNAFTGAIAGNTLTVSAVATGTVALGQTITGTGVAAGTIITALGTGTGGTGTYTVSQTQTAGSTSLSGSGGTLTVTAVASGTLALGQVVTGSGVSANTTITALLTGTGGNGTYLVSVSQTAVSTSLVAAIGGAAFTGAIAANSFTGAISGTILTVSAVSTGSLAVGQTVYGAAVLAGTIITALGSGTGGTGTYTISQSQTISSESMTTSGSTLTVSAVASGTIGVGQTIAGTGIVAGTQIIGLGTGIGGTGTYILNNSITVSSEAITAAATAVTVTYDSISAGFVITSGVSGPTSTIAFAAGTLATPLCLTSATGAVISQGSAPAVPGAFMTNLLTQATDWASFTTAWEPTTIEQLAFALWTNQQQNRFCFVAWDTDITATQTTFTGLGYQLMLNTYSGTHLIYTPVNGAAMAAFAMGYGAGLDFTQTHGRATAAYKSQSGLTADVTNVAYAANLTANGYSFYGGVATANDYFTYYVNGNVPGPYLWLDSYMNQIWLNNQLQLAILVGLTQTKAVPYVTAGYNLIRAWCQDPINQAINFGAIVPGVTLSAAQTAEINYAAGSDIAQTLMNQGYYLQIQDALPQVRMVRGSPPITLWYLDGGSVQKINVQSIEVQ